MAEGCTDSNSTATSLEDHSDDFEDNPTRDTITEGLLNLLKPSVEQLDTQVERTREAQIELRDQIDLLAADLKTISEQQASPIDLESYITKLSNSKKRVLVVQNVLASAQDRLNRVHQSCLRETNRRRAQLESSPNTSPQQENPARLPN